MSEKPKQTEEKKQPKAVKIPKRRVRVMMVNPTDFMFLFTKGMRFRKQTQIVEGLPDDAVLVGIAYDLSRNGIMMVIESADYDPIPITVVPPTQLVKIEVGMKGATKKKKHARKKR